MEKSGSRVKQDTPEPQQGGEGPNPQNRRRILVVDDEPAVLQLVSQILSEAGYEVLTAGDGRAALSVVADGWIDLVITDLSMPELDGIELIRHLQKQSPSLPIAAMSGAFGGHYLKVALRLGVQAAILKPFSASALIDAVKPLLGEPL